MLRRLLPLLAAIMLSVACADADKQAEPTPTKEPFIDTTPQPVGTATGELQNALLEAEDLGEGWSAQGTGDATEADTYYCGRKLELAATDALAIFAHQDGRVVFEGIVVAPDAAAAAADMQRLRDAHEGCDQFISTDGERRTEWRTDEFRDVALADEAVLEVASTDAFGAVPATSYNIALRRGPAIIVISLVGVEGDAERQITEIAGLALKEYERASAP